MYTSVSKGNNYIVENHLHEFGHYLIHLLSRVKKFQKGQQSAWYNPGDNLTQKLLKRAQDELFATTSGLGFESALRRKPSMMVADLDLDWETFKNSPPNQTYQYLHQFKGELSEETYLEVKTDFRKTIEAGAVALLQFQANKDLLGLNDGLGIVQAFILSYPMADWPAKLGELGQRANEVREIASEIMGYVNKVRNVWFLADDAQDEAKQALEKDLAALMDLTKQVKAYAQFKNSEQPQIDRAYLDLIKWRIKTRYAPETLSPQAVEVASSYAQVSLLLEEIKDMTNPSTEKGRQLFGEDWQYLSGLLTELQAYSKEENHTKPAVSVETIRNIAERVKVGYNLPEA